MWLLAPKDFSRVYVTKFSNLFGTQIRMDVKSKYKKVSVKTIFQSEKIKVGK